MAAAKSNAVNKISAAIIFSLTGFLPSITSKVFSSLHKLLLLVQPLLCIFRLKQHNVTLPSVLS
jgi:hypothetical protein